MTNGFIIAVAIISFLMSYSMGANDAANALATSYGSKAAPILLLLILGAIFEFVGAFWCSGQVAGKLAKNILPNIKNLPELEQDQLMLAVSTASFLFILSSSIFGMPISGTHTVVGALIGAGLAASTKIGWH